MRAREGPTHRILAYWFHLAAQPSRYSEDEHQKQVYYSSEIAPGILECFWNAAGILVDRSLQGAGS